MTRYLRAAAYIAALTLTALLYIWATHAIHDAARKLAVCPTLPYERGERPECVRTGRE